LRLPLEVGGSKRRRKRMSRKSLYLVICLAAIMMVFTVTETYASPARVAGLNLTGHRAMFTRDYVNTYPYPVAITRYTNMAWANLGHSGSGMYARDRVMGLFHEMGEDGHYGVLGITLRECSPQDPILWSMVPEGSSAEDLMGVSHQQFDIIWGRDFEQASFGLRFDMARSSCKDEDSGDVWAPCEVDEYGNYEYGWFNTWAIAGAVDYDLTEDAMLEVGGEVRQYTVQNDLDEITDDGSMSFRVSARVFYERAANKTMIPLVTYMRTDLGLENSVLETYTLDDMMLGAACNHVVNGDDLLIYGAAFRYRSWESTMDDVIEDDFTRRDFPVLFCALEHRFRDWLVGRGGASQAMVSNDFIEEDVDYPDWNWLWSDFDFALGIGLEFTNFTIDATLNQNYPFTGFWFVSGQSTPRDLFGQVSFTYTY
jgi:hypothetical protein